MSASSAPVRATCACQFVTAWIVVRNDIGRPCWVCGQPLEPTGTTEATKTTPKPTSEETATRPVATKPMATSAAQLFAPEISTDSLGETRARKEA